MRSLLVEFHRFNDLSEGILQGCYLVAAASHPVREYKWPLQHTAFLDLMLDLRYQSSAGAREAALKKIGVIVTDMLGSRHLRHVENNGYPLQLDLVVNAAELAAVPFEAATDDKGQPLFVQDERVIELTRRVRHDFAEISVRWPAQPRILFAWACPPGAGVEVPFKEHGDALRAAVKPWVPVEKAGGSVPDPGEVLTTLKQASLTKLERACRDAVEAKKPFSHVHLLAHGYPVGREHHRRFGIAMHAEDGDLEAVTPEAVKEALAPLSSLPVIVTLATCDAANMTNTIAPEKSIAHQLHVSGFPVVVASQLPFTVRGANLMVKRFYQALLSGTDVRLAIHKTRVALYQNRQDTGHDWASLVGYVRLNEGYADHLLDVRLESVLAALKNAQDWSDKLVKSNESDLKLFDRVTELLRQRIEQLEGFLRDTEKIGRRGVLQENLGLLGSAEKRLAELCFVRSARSDMDHWRQQMREALERSFSWYRRGYDHNLSHHWTGVQYLSLDAVLHGTISRPGHWHAAVAAAEIDRKKPGEFWADGSLAELYLLAPTAGQVPHAQAANEALEEMKGRVRDYAAGDRFPLESTEHQLGRYTDWWTTANDFFPGAFDLTAEAGRLIEVLRR